METKQFTIPALNLPAWTMAEEIGYEPQTTFWQDFCIAEKFGGIEGVKDTFKRAFAEWREDSEYLAEMALVLNHRGWVWWHVSERLKQSDNEQERGKVYIAICIADCYFDLYKDVVTWARDNYGEEDLEYFNKTID